MKKDHTLEEAYVQIARMQKAGLIFNAHMMTGIAGKGRGIENAEATAEFFNRTQPERVINFNIFHHRRAPLWKDIEEGRYELSGRAALDELKEIGIELESDDVDTIGGYLSVDAGHVPQKGEEFRLAGWIFTIAEADAKQIHTVLAQREE
jgi:histone acetyltransferase (RNA polymerase elongator complex component)